MILRRMDEVQTQNRRGLAIALWIILTLIPLLFVLAQWRHHELVIASSAGHDTEIRILVSLGADVNFMSRGNIPLTADSKRGQLETVKLLLEYGARIDETTRGGETALMKAASTGNADIVRLLVGRGADLNIRSSAGNTALMLAEQKGHLEIVNFLRSAGATK